MTGPVHALVDHLFRREAARSVGRLTRLLGPRHLELAEEAVHEALVAALRTWPFRGVPDDPAAWLLATARNRALDHLRREGRFRELAAGRLDELRRALRGSGDTEDAPALPALDGELTDDELRAVFLCCHPALTEPSRVALTLKLVGGLSVPEIARALLARETAVAQRLVRAQRTLREGADTGEVTFEVPSGDELLERLESVLAVIYLIFNEGYAASSGDHLVRRELVDEALRLGKALTQVLPEAARPPVHALQALMLYGASRLAARTGPEGELMLLPDQDRSLWDRRLMARAFAHLAASARGTRETRYHLEAAIASVHARVVDPVDPAGPADAGTDWGEILTLYDRLLALDDSPVVQLNRAVAVAQRDGPAAGLAALDEIPDTGPLAGYHLYHAARARWLAELGRRDEARRALARAMECGSSAPERFFLRERLGQLVDA